METGNNGVGISYAVAEDAATQLGDQMKQVEDLLGDISAVENSLSEDIWDGSDADFFRSNFPDFKEKMNTIANDIKGIKGWVDDAVIQFHALEGTNANAMAETMSGLRV